MNSLGIVSDINHRGELLVNGRDARKPGTVVYDVRKQKIGTVLRTFGPVSSPYLLVKTMGIPDNDKLRLLNSELYFDKEGSEKVRKGVSNPGMGKSGVSKYGKKKRKNR